VRILTRRQCCLLAGAMTASYGCSTAACVWPSIPFLAVSARSPMTYRARPPVGRNAGAAVELAFVLPVILILIFGIWDVGRLVETQQLVSNAARDGARLAAIGVLLDPTTGAQKNLYFTDVQQAVLGYLARNGISTTGVTVQYTDLDNSGATDPYLANHLERLQVTVQLPFSNVRLLLLNNFVNVNYTTITSTALWLCNQDVDVSVGTSLPVG
jgi:Flp pilus assembly protein TadG